jgi:hypothetical protein
MNRGREAIWGVDFSSKPRARGERLSCNLLARSPPRSQLCGVNVWGVNLTERGDQKKAGSGRSRKRRSKSRFGSWLTSFSGILASVATIVAALASVVAAHQTSRVDQLTVVVKQQRQQLQASAAKPAAARSAAVPSNSVGGAALTGGAYLSALQPTLDDASLQTGPQTMSSTAYQDSVTFDCDGPGGNDQPDEAFDVAGHTLFRAVVGIPDNAQDATNLNETITFANQSGTQLMKPVVVSLGNPAVVRLNISGVTQLEVICSGTNSETQAQDNGNQLTLGNANISG